MHFEKFVCKLFAACAAAFEHLCVSVTAGERVSMPFVCFWNFVLFLPQILKFGDVRISFFTEYEILQIFLKTKSNLVSFQRNIVARKGKNGQRVLISYIGWVS